MKEYSFQVEGVTLAAQDGSSRQEAIKRMFQEELQKESILRDHRVNLKKHEFDEVETLIVFADDVEIGFIPADKMKAVKEAAAKAVKCDVALALNGYGVEEYEFIVDQHRNKEEWKKNDPFFDEEAVEKKYYEVKDGVLKNESYTAQLVYYVEE